LLSILEKSNTCDFIKDFSKVKYNDNQYSKNPFYIYNNYFFKLVVKDKNMNPNADNFIRNEYNFYNKVKEDKELNEQLGKNINEYYGCYDKKIDGNVSWIFTVSNNLEKDGFTDFSKFLSKQQVVKYLVLRKIIKQVLEIHSNLAQKGLYNWDLKLENIMIKDKGKDQYDIKLIDYEGILPKDSSNIITTRSLPQQTYLLSDENLRPIYYDYIKFNFIMKALNFSSIKDNEVKDYIVNCGYKIDEIEDKLVRNEKITDVNEIQAFLTECKESFLKYPAKNNANNKIFWWVLNHFNINEEYVNNIANLVGNIGAFYGDGIVSDKDAEEINGKLFEEKKRNNKDKIIVLDKLKLFINQSNKLIPIRKNSRFIKDINSLNTESLYYYYDIKEAKIKRNQYIYFSFINIKDQKNNCFKNIDDTNLLQILVLGTLMKKAVVDNVDTSMTKENDGSTILKNIKNEVLSLFSDNKKVEQFFGPEAFKKVFMEIIDADKILLDSFFDSNDFNKDCKLTRENDNNKFYLTFSSGLKLELSKYEADKILAKFPEVKVAPPPPPPPAKPIIREKEIKNIRFKKYNNVTYEHLFAIQIPVIRGKNKEILTDDNGNNIKLKLNVVYAKNGLSYQFIGQNKKIVDKLKKEGKLSNDLTELKPLADLLFIDRYCTDNIIRDKIAKEKLLTKKQVDTLSAYIKDENKNYYDLEKQVTDLGYTITEMEELLADTPSRTNTYVGVKDVELQVNKWLLDKNNDNVSREIQRLKRAGISKVVLLQDNEVSNKDMYIIILRLRKSGLQPIIGITEEMLSVLKGKESIIKDLIKESSRLKALAGFRIMFDISSKLEQGEEVKRELLNLIKTSGKEISYKTNTLDKKIIDSADVLFEGKVIFVVDGKQIIEDDKEEEIKFKNEDIFEGISKLAGEGRLSLYFATDKEEKDLELAKKLVKKIFGESATKTMISLGTTFTTNMFAGLFKKDAPSKCFSNAYELGYEAVFGNVSPEKVAGVFKEVLTGKIDYEKFKENYDNNKEENKDVFTTEFDNIVASSIEKETNLKSEEKMAMLRQYVMGFMVSYIEKHFEDFYEIPEWNIIDIKQMDINVKNQIIYRIMSLMLSGKSPKEIKENLSDVAKNKDNQNEDSMEQMVKAIKNNETSQIISKMLLKTDSVIDSKMIFDKEVIPMTMYNDINILLEDSLLPMVTNKYEEADMIRSLRSISKKA
jgi:hypothetical protein